MTDQLRIKKLVHMLKEHYASRHDCIEAAQLIEQAYVGNRYIHKKRGSVYTVVGEARLQYGDVVPKDGDMLTLYRGDDGVYSVRHPDEFNDGRFEELLE